MKLLKKINCLVFFLSLYDIFVEAKRTQQEKDLKSILRLKLKRNKQKSKKQYFPFGQVSQYPNPYMLPQYKPVGTNSKGGVKIVKGLPRRYDCAYAKHGCCWDGRSPAIGPAGKGCPQCRDIYEDFCKQTKKLCHYPMIADYCRVTCKLCRKQKKGNCQSSLHNCCWDGKTSAKGQNGKGCPEIKDDHSAECKKFDSECLRNPYFMWTKCRKTCLDNLPPIAPFLHSFGPGNNIGTLPSCSQSMFPGMSQQQTSPGIPYPFNYPGMSAGKKTSTSRKHQAGGCPLVTLTKDYKPRTSEKMQH